MLTITIAGLLLAVFYWYLTRTFDYWTKRGIKHDRPILFFGTNMKNYLLQANFRDMTTETYNKYPEEKLVGFFRGTDPELIIRDPELAKLITISDFKSFHRRRVVYSSPRTVMLKQPIFADDDLWRQLRERWTPAFSSGKIKAIFPVLTERVESLQTRLHSIAIRGQPVDAKDLMARLISDVIGSVVFGVKCDSINIDNDAIRRLGNKIFMVTITRVIKLTLQYYMPKIFRHLNVFSDIENEAIEMVKTIMQYRNYEPSGRQDFLDIFLEVKKKGAMTGDSIVEINTDGTAKKVSIEVDDALVAAQCLVFFGVGFESISAVTSYTLHELAHNPRIQEKVQEGIDSVLARHDNKLSYEAISEMNYLRWCINEAERLNPFAGVLMRECVLSYTFPESKTTIDPGVRVVIPLKAYYNDPKIFPEPHEFRPERFDPAVMTPAQKATYLPFGSGPRSCLGKRLAVTLAMAGLAAVLVEYSVQPAPGAPRQAGPTATCNVANLSKRGLPLVFQKRRHL